MNNSFLENGKSNPIHLSKLLVKVKIESGLPFPTQGNLPNPGVKPMSPATPASAGAFFTTVSPEQPPPWAQGWLPNDSYMTTPEVLPRNGPKLQIHLHLFSVWSKCSFPEWSYLFKPAFRKVSDTLWWLFLWVWCTRNAPALYSQSFRQTPYLFFVS